ncbi:zinc ABC transporter substrate-binding protein [Pelagibacterium montanilacus]|uniref:zinc ABC transporter substrate-binding protein n=1 Tax=Pelagibacterium montanilacus TaxID=2185280 RepID=UPI000F8D452A|nr:zinc ABC transporter substrate-binding protein [Pelagibacterium montanilacus]
MPLRSPLVLGAALVALMVASPAFAAPQVLTTIKPLHSLVAGVMDGVGEPELLIDGAASPHGFSMRPSDAARLEGAEVVFWIGAGLETFLDGALQTLASDASVVAMMDVEGMTILELREGGRFEEHDHDHDDHDDHGGDEHNHAEDHENPGDDDHEHQGEDHDHHEHDDDAHDHDHGDAHIWLDPQNARLMVAAIVDALGTADPENAAIYNDNGQAIAARLNELEARIGEQLEPVRGKPFFLFHDAYHYFEARFGIEASGTFTVNPEVAPGAGRLTEIREMVEAEEAVCLFAEPQFSPQVIDTIAEGTGARLGELDPLGAAIPEGPELYFTLIETMAQSLADCLAD